MAKFDRNQDKFKGDKKHLRTLLDSIERGDMSLWNRWRDDNPGETPNLAGSNLEGASLSKGNFSGAAMSQADLRSCDLTGANFTEADLQSTDMTGADFTGANLTETNLVRANLSRGDLRKVPLWHANLSEATLSGADLSEANLVSASLKGAELSRTNFRNATLRHADLSHAILAETAMAGAALTSANLSEADIRETILWRANLKGADFSKAHLKEVMLWRSDVREANFVGAVFDRCNFSEATVDRAVFDEAVEYVDLGQCVGEPQLKMSEGAEADIGALVEKHTVLAEIKVGFDDSITALDLATILHFLDSNLYDYEHSLMVKMTEVLELEPALGDACFQRLRRSRGEILRLTAFASGSVTISAILTGVAIRTLNDTIEESVRVAYKKIVLHRKLADVLVVEDTARDLMTRLNDAHANSREMQRYRMVVKLEENKQTGRDSLHIELERKEEPKKPKVQAPKTDAVVFEVKAPAEKQEPQEGAAKGAEKKDEKKPPDDEPPILRGGQELFLMRDNRIELDEDEKGSPPKTKPEGPRPKLPRF